MHYKHREEVIQLQTSWVIKNRNSSYWTWTKKRESIHISTKYSKPFRCWAGCKLKHISSINVPAIQINPIAVCSPGKLCRSSIVDVDWSMWMSLSVAENSSKIFTSFNFYVPFCRRCFSYSCCWCCWVFIQKRQAKITYCLNMESFGRCCCWCYCCCCCCSLVIFFLIFCSLLSPLLVLLLLLLSFFLPLYLSLSLRQYAIDLGNMLQMSTN